MANFGLPFGLMRVTSSARAEPARKLSSVVGFEAMFWPVERTQGADLFHHLVISSASLTPSAALAQTSLTRSGFNSHLGQGAAQQQVNGARLCSSAPGSDIHPDGSR
jgi:hypothetical protein